VEEFSTKEHWRELVSYINAVPHVIIKRLDMGAPLDFAFWNIESLV
jgi:hypothetical protein